MYVCMYVIYINMYSLYDTNYYTYTPSQTDQYTFSTCNTANFDTMISVQYGCEYVGR